MNVQYKLIKKIASETRKELESFSRKIHIRGSNKQTLQGFCLIGTYLFCEVASEFNIDAVPVYGDAAFKFDFPTKKGANFSLWDIANTSTAYIHYGADFLHSSTYKYFVCSENGSNNNGGIYLDSLSLKEITGE